MTSASSRRLAKIEGALEPREAVLAWLAEAQGYASAADHARAIAALPVEAAPLSVIASRVVAAVRAARKGQPRSEVEQAALRAQAHAVFLFALVMSLNVHAYEVAELEGLRAAATFFWLGALLGGPHEPPATDADARERREAWQSWRAVVAHLEANARIETAARVSLEQQYLGGHECLLADAKADWARYEDLVTRVARMAELVPEIEPAKRPKPASDEAARVRALAIRLADNARVKAFEILGDRERAVSIMERRLQAEAHPDSSTL